MTKETQSIEIVDRGHDWFTVAKPCGLRTQAPKGNDSLETVLRRQLGLDPTGYCVPVHRLDFPVSGLVLFATTKKAARLLNQQFAARLVDKVYFAVVEGELTESEANESAQQQTWTDWIAKIPEQPRVQIVSQHDGRNLAAKKAITEVESLGFDRVCQRSLLRLRPKTGRMHQLRVQLAYRGLPILGETLYGGSDHDRIVGTDRTAATNPRESSEDADETGDRLPQQSGVSDSAPCQSGEIALHAGILSFRDPRSAKPVTCRCPAKRLWAMLDGTVLPPVDELPERFPDGEAQKQGFDGLSNDHPDG